MKSYDLLMLANKNLWRRKARTLLTILGMTIGIISIVVMFSLGIGLTEWQRKSMEQWGGLNIITVHMSFFSPEMPEEELKLQKLLNDDAVAEIKAMPGVLGVSPSFTVQGEARKGKETGFVSIVGIDPGKMELMEFRTTAGRLLQNGDSFNAVAGSFVINNFMEPGAAYQQSWTGPELRDPLELLDQRLTIIVQNAGGQKRRYTFNVVGIMDDQAMEHAHNLYAPLNVVRQIRGFINQGAQQAQPRRQEVQYDFITVRTKDVENTNRLLIEMRAMGHQASSMAEGLEGIEQSTKIIQAIFGGIGAVSLLVAAIGITNTMVMSIYERTREIAVIKVLGASFSTIRWLFLVESSLIGILGGTLGLVFSYLLSMLINMYAGASIGANAMGPDALAVQISLIPLWLAVFSMLFGATVGLIAGLFPAIWAMRLDPVTAMRHS